MKKTVLILIACLIYYTACCKASLSEIIMVKSNGNVISYEMAAEGFRHVIDEKIVEYDMELNSSKGRKIVKKIKKRAKSKNPPLAILAIGHFAAKLVSEKIKNIPMIFCMVVNPERSDFIRNRNIAGVSFDLSPEHQLKRLKQVIPEAMNIGVIYNPKESGNIIKKAKTVASSLGLNIMARKVSTLKEVADVLPSLIKEIDTLWIIPDKTVLSRKTFKFINLNALRYCTPVMACSPQLVEMGAPFSFFAEPYSVGQQAGAICKKILNGEINAPLPIEVPNDIFLAINLSTMKRCGIDLPQKLIDAAKLIYE